MRTTGDTDSSQGRSQTFPLLNKDFHAKHAVSRIGSKSYDCRKYNDKRNKRFLAEPLVSLSVIICSIEIEREKSYNNLCFGNVGSICLYTLNYLLEKRQCNRYLK